MSMQLLRMLEEWLPARDQGDWVLGTVFKTEGSSYRKAGAMSLIGSEGAQLGLLSGGCLEADVRLNARKVMSSGKALSLRYDGDDEDDLSYHLGIGCGGIVHILLEPIHAGNNYQQLAELHSALQNRQSGRLHKHIAQTNEVPEHSKFSPDPNLSRKPAAAQLKDSDNVTWLDIPIAPPPHLLIGGGGIDAQPVVKLAKLLGWEVTVWDPRPANARDEFFQDADFRLRCSASELSSWVNDYAINAAMVMTHNLAMDSDCINAINRQGLDYIGLLGPTHRKEEVLQLAGLGEHEVSPLINGPAGFDIGGDLPESIALSMLSKCHETLFKNPSS